VQGKELSEQASKYKKEARKLLEEKEKSGKFPNQTKSKRTFMASRSKQQTTDFWFF
jgi:hypothetical protein